MENQFYVIFGERVTNACQIYKYADDNDEEMMGKLRFTPSIRQSKCEHIVKAG